MNYYNSCTLNKLYVYLPFIFNQMEKENWILWNNITFKTQSYRKNFDIVNQNENFITEHHGVVSEIRIIEKKPPLPIGEYDFSIWNIALGKKFGVDFNKLISEYSFEDTYHDLFKLIQSNKLNINNYKKIILINSFVIHKNYRKRNVTEEFIEMLYRDFYNEDVAIIALVKPVQNNTVDVNYFFNEKFVLIRDTLQKSDGINVSAKNYYSLDELTEKKDTELNEYKLFTIATKCGFKRIDESYLFYFTPKNIEKRMIEKRKYSHLIEIQKHKHL